MRRRVSRWCFGVMAAAALVASMLLGSTKPTTVYGADPTPTATSQPNGGPGSGGGNGGM